MTKHEVLAVFDGAWGYLRPDQVRSRVNPAPDRRSMYSYLLRLAKQGLLERRPGRRGTLAYRLTERGRSRLQHFEKQKNRLEKI